MLAREEAVFVFPSTHHMLRAEALLKEGGFRIRLVPAPPGAGELCTTAIAVPAPEGEAAAGLLQGRGVLLSAVLYPAEAGAAVPGGLSRQLVSDLSAYPGLGEVLEKITRREGLERRDVVGLLELEGGEEALCRASEAVAAALTGREAVPAAVLDLSGGMAGGPGAVNPGWRSDNLSVEGLRMLADEMARLGLVYLVVSLGERRELPWSAEEFREALGGDIVTVVHAQRLPPGAGELVRDYGVRQVLLRRDDLYRMDARDLADEILFLRDNRPGPVGSGNLLPLFSRGINGVEETGRLRRVMAVLRLVLGEAFLPLPGVLWRKGCLCGGNFLVLESSGRKGIEETLEEAENSLAAAGWRVKRVGR